jgi:hypothetical protein
MLNNIISNLPDYLLVIITLVYSIFTWQTLKANKEMVRESQLNREIDQKPDVIAFFEEGHTTSVLNFVVKNIGRGIAEDVKLKMVSSNNSLGDFSEANFLSNPIRTLAPQQKIEAMVGVFHQLIGDDGEFPKMEIEISYRSKYGRTYTDYYYLDTSMYKGIRQMVVRGSHDIAKEMKEVNKNLDKLNKEIKKLNT